MTTAPFRTKAERRIEELEALQHPLTSKEGAELRRCLHAIYVRARRLEKVVRGSSIVVDIHAESKAEIEPIAQRMEEAVEEDWPDIPAKPEQWQRRASRHSRQLCDAILKAGLRP